MADLSKADAELNRRAPQPQPITLTRRRWSTTSGLVAWARCVEREGNTLYMSETGRQRF
jgi:hypothetical protein